MGTKSCIQTRLIHNAIYLCADGMEEKKSVDSQFVRFPFVYRADRNTLPNTPESFVFVKFDDNI